MKADIFYFARYRAHRDLHSFPTRRSSDLAPNVHAVVCTKARTSVSEPKVRRMILFMTASCLVRTDRKSTRLELQSPYDLVCRLLLEKKKHIQVLPSVVKLVPVAEIYCVLD